MRYAVVDQGKVVNVATSNSALGANWIASDSAQIGDLWDGSQFTKPAPVVVIPEKVTRRQAKQALALAGLLANVQPAIDAIADPTQRALMQIEWDDSQEFYRNRASLIQLATALGLTSAQIDQLFITAAGL